MPDNDNLRRLYGNLVKEGYDMPTYEQFASDMRDNSNMQRLYTNLNKEGYEMPSTYQAFRSDMGFGDTNSVAPASTRTAVDGGEPKERRNKVGLSDIRNRLGQKEQEATGNRIGILPTRSDGGVRTGGNNTPTGSTSSSSNDVYEQVWNDADKRSDEGKWLKPLDTDKFDKVFPGASKMMQAGMTYMGVLPAVASQVVRGHNESVRMREHDRDKLAEDAWQRLGEEGQTALAREMYAQLKAQYPEASQEDLTAAAWEAARKKNDRLMFEKAVEKNMPQNAVDQFFDKVLSQNTVNILTDAGARMAADGLGDWEAQDEARRRYLEEGKGRGAVDLAGNIFGFAGDPLTLATAGAGSVAVKGAQALGKKMLGSALTKQMSKNAAGRAVIKAAGKEAAQKTALGSVGGAVNLGLYEAGSSARDQLRLGGELQSVDDEGRYIIGDFSGGNILKSGLHGAAMGGVTGGFGGWFGNASDKWVRGINNTGGKIAMRGATTAGGVLAEGTIFATPDMVQAWNTYNEEIEKLSQPGSRTYIADENERVMAIAELKEQRNAEVYDAWKESEKMMAGFKVHHLVKSAPERINELRNDPRSRAGFETRLRRVVDGKQGNAFTNDEREELEKAGYGDINNIVYEYKKSLKDNGDKKGEAEAGELPTGRIIDLVNDNNVSEAARAKVYWLVTGKMLPMHMAMRPDYVEVKDDNGKVTGYRVRSLGENGTVITSRTFNNKHAADAELSRVQRQIELNGIAVGERRYAALGDERSLYDACQTVANQKNVPADMLYSMMRMKPEDMTPAQLQWANEIKKAYEHNKELTFYKRYSPKGVADEIEDQYGVDLDEAIGKEKSRRSAEEDAAVERYAYRLLNKEGVGGEFEDKSAAYRQGYNTSDAEQRKAIALELAEAEEGSERRAELEEAWEGVKRRIGDERSYLVAMAREERKMREYEADGTERPITLKETDEEGKDKVVYLKGGDLVTTADGAVDESNSSQMITVYDPAEGKVKPMPLKDIKSVEAPIDAETFNAELEREGREYYGRQLDEAENRVVPGKEFVDDDGVRAVVVAVGNGEARYVREDNKRGIVSLDKLQEIVNRDALSQLRGEQEETKAPADVAGEAKEETGAKPEGGAVENEEEVKQGADAEAKNASAAGNGNGMVQGAPKEYENKMRIFVRENEGEEPKEMVVVGRVRAIDGGRDYELDPQGTIIEYFDPNDPMDVRHDRIENLETKVVGHEASAAPKQEAVAERQAVENRQAPAMNTEEAMRGVDNTAGVQPEGVTDDNAMPMRVEKGKSKPDFDKATPEQSRKYIYEDKGLSQEEADAFVDGKIGEIDEALAEKEKNVPKMGGDIDDYKAKKETWQRTVEDLRRRKAYWETVKGTEGREVAQGNAPVEGTGDNAQPVEEVSEARKMYDSLKEKYQAKAAQKLQVTVNDKVKNVEAKKKALNEALKAYDNAPIGKKEATAAKKVEEKRKALADAEADLAMWRAVQVEQMNERAQEIEAEEAEKKARIERARQQTEIAKAEEQRRYEAEMERRKAAEAEQKKRLEDEIAMLEKMEDSAIDEWKLEDDAEAMEVMRNTDPQTLEEIAAWLLSGGKDKLIPSETRRHTGYSTADFERMPFIFAKAENGGISPEHMGEKIEVAAKENGVFFDETDTNAGFNALLRVLSEVRTMGDLHNYIKNNRKALAEEIHRNNQRRAAEVKSEDGWIMEHGGMTRNEFSNYINWMEDAAEQRRYDISDEEFNQLFNTDYDTRTATNDERGEQRGAGESGTDESGTRQAATEADDTRRNGEEVAEPGTAGKPEGAVDEQTAEDAEYQRHYDAATKEIDNILNGVERGSGVVASPEMTDAIQKISDMEAEAEERLEDTALPENERVRLQAQYDAASKWMDDNVRSHKAENEALEAPTQEQKAVVEGVADLLNEHGIETHLVTEEGQQMLDKYREIAKMLKAWHGSASDFEKFENSHIGEGIGVQRHGHGFYVTTRQGDAKGYAMNVAQSRGGEPIVYEVEIPEDNGSNYIDWTATIPKSERRKIAEAVRAIPEERLTRERHGDNWLPGGFGQLADMIEKNAWGGMDIYDRLYDATGSTKLTSDLLSGLGYKGVRVHEFTMPEGEYTYVVFNDGDMKITDKIRFHKAADGSYEPDVKPWLYSNAMRTVEGIKQEKATAEQWLAMLQKNGGMKAGEDKWTGLSDWLKEQKGKSLTKQEVLDYLRENAIEIEEVEYSNDAIKSLQEEYDKLVEENGGEKGKAWSELNKRYNDKYDVYLEDYVANYDGELAVRRGQEYGLEKIGLSRPINETRLQYTTDFLDNKREIALVVSSIEPWNESDVVHFGDAGKGRAVAWVRFGETTDADGKRVLVIDEIQSKRHQEGREKGYGATKGQLDELRNRYEAKMKELEDYRKELEEKYGDEVLIGMDGKVTAEEYAKYQRLHNEANEAQGKLQDQYINYSNRPDAVPDAPFDKNWHEVAFKRILRYAAENGYDKVAWTTGTQQAERYDLGEKISKIDVSNSQDGTKLVTLNFRNRAEQYEDLYQFSVNNEGRVVSGDFADKELSDVVGKEMAKKIMAADQPSVSFSGEDLRVGADGMKGFYDQILPRFADKYGKKWNVKTTDIELPNIGDNGLTMHSVDVTPEMRKSVMEGQPMFYKTPDGEVYGFTLRGKIYIDPRVAKPDTPVHEYTHLMGDAIERSDPKAFARLGEVMRTVEDGMLWEYVSKRYPELADKPNEMVKEVFAHYSGKRGRERLEKEMREEMDKANGYFEKAKVANMFHRLRELLNDFWNMAKDLFAGKVKDIDKWSADDFADATFAAMTHGFDPRTVKGKGEKKLTAEDKTYLEAVKKGDMETAQRMVNEAAEKAGYTANEDYKDSHHAPVADVDREDFRNLDAIREVVENDGSASNLFSMAQGVSIVPDDYLSANGPRWYGYQNWTGGMESYYNLRNVINEIQRQVREYGEVKDMPTIKVYRAVPKDIKAGQLESEGQWVSPSREYAVRHGQSRFGFGEYRVIEQDVKADELWFDGNDIREWGFDDGTKNAYQNTKNNRKLLDAVTYDDEGNVIPLSQRFNKRNADIRYQKGRTLYGLNSGYTTRDNGTAISVRAEEAEANGKYTAGKFRTQYNVATKDFEPLKELGLIHSKEWHHTGRSYKESDFYEWSDHNKNDYSAENLTPEGSMAARYQEKKKEIAELTKAYESAEWENEPTESLIYVPDYESFKNDYMYWHTDEMLTDAEKEQRQERHDLISSQRGSMSGYERKLEHESLDNEYRQLAVSRVNDADVRAQYEAQYGENIEKNKQIEAENEARTRRNAETQGKEKILAQIGEAMGMSKEEAEQKAQTASIKHWEEAKAEQRRKANEELDSRVEQIRDDGRKKQQAYIERMIKDGKAERVERKREKPEMFIAEKEEMNGRYGWFEATSRYNLPIYYSGIAFKDQRAYNHYNKIGEETSKKIIAAYAEGESENDIRFQKVWNYKKADNAVDEDGSIRGRMVDDGEEIARLESEPKEVGYRNVVMNSDGTLGSPMASRLGKRGSGSKKTSAFEFGAWEQADENPDMATDDGKVNLIKPDGKSVDAVDYNPYIHIRPSLVNKQFKQAWERPNLVYVRTEYPASELTSGYKADKAKKSVGRHDWNGGELILSRWDKPKEIVPWEEVADDWVKEFAGKEIPFDIVPPKLLPILAERGMNIVEPHKGMGKACYEAYETWKNDPETYYNTMEERGIEGDRQHDESMQRRERRYKEQGRRAKEFAEKLNLGDRIRIIDDSSTLTGRKARLKGWYDTETGEINIVIDKHGSVDDVLKTVLHEGVAHHGLRELFGKSFDNFLDNVFTSATRDIQREIYHLAADKYNYDFREATEEYLAKMAEEMDFDRPEHVRMWNKVKSLFFEMLSKLGIKGFHVENAIGDNELQYLLWSSYKNLREPGSVKIRDYEDTARDIAMQSKLNVGEFEPESVRKWRDIAAESRQIMDEAGFGEEVQRDVLNEMMREENIRGRDEEDEADKPQRLGLHERITETMLNMAAENEGDKAMRSRALAAVNANLSDLRKAMGVQKSYDKATVKRVTDLARVLIKSGDLDGVTNGELGRMLTAVKDATGRDDISDQVQTIMDIMVDSQLRKAEKRMKELENIKGSKVDSRLVNVQGKLDVAGQRMLETFKNAKGMQLIGENSIASMMADAMERMGSKDDIVANEAAMEYAGYHLAKDYIEQVKQSEIEEGDLNRQIKEELSKVYDFNTEEIKDENGNTIMRKDGEPMTRTVNHVKSEFKPVMEPVYDADGNPVLTETGRQKMRVAVPVSKENKHIRKAVEETVSALEEAIRENKIERVEAYNNLVNRLSGDIQNSMADAKQWAEKQKERVRDIQHNANSDMEGRPANEHYKEPTWVQNSSNAIANSLLSPLQTFNEMLRMFGSKSANGEGYLFNRFARGLIDSRQKEIRGLRSKYAILDAKAKEVFGDGVKNWADLMKAAGKLPSLNVKFWDGDTMQNHELHQGILMYMYMVDKMSDGRMKLRRMGITEEDMKKVDEVLDDRLKQIADWLQDEFLVDSRKEYNETHKRMFGSSMTAVEHYFPLKINQQSRVKDAEKEDEKDRQNGALSTTTGAIKRRTQNTTALDLLNADALHVILDHVDEMEHWNAFAELDRDINTLRSYKRFENQVRNMNTIYGNGETLWRNFRDVCQLATGTYDPKQSKHEKAALKVAQNVSTAKVAFRINTALKQLLSLPNYAPYINAKGFYNSVAKNMTNMIKALKGDEHGAMTSFQWCMENLPMFEERWKSRVSGDPKLAKSVMDWQDKRANAIQWIGRIGMLPNAAIDAFTVSIGAHAVYETRLNQYLKEGYSREAAEKRAKQDAEMAYNETQQSSEGGFVSTMQKDHTWWSTMFSVFRNASMSYTRRVLSAGRNIGHNVKPSQRKATLEFMTKQLMRDGISEENAEEIAKSRFNRAMRKNVIDLATFGFITEFAWNLGNKMWYILFGDDDEKKLDMIKDAGAQAMFGSLEGLVGGDVISEFGRQLVRRDYNPNNLNKDMPITTDIATLLQKFAQGKNEEALYSLFNTAVQMGGGVNPESISDFILSITDICGGDMALSNEAALFAARFVNAPQSQIRDLYFDEIGMTGEEASHYTPQQLAERYAKYQVKRGRIIEPWTWTDDKAISKEVSKANKYIKERTENIGGKEANEGYEEYAERIEDFKKQFEEMKSTQEYKDAYAYEKAEMIVEFNAEHPETSAEYLRFTSMDNMLDKMVGHYLKSRNTYESEWCKKCIADYKKQMVAVMDADDDKRPAEREKLAKIINDFYSELGRMQPSRTQEYKLYNEEDRVLDKLYDSFYDAERAESDAQ